MDELRHYGVLGMKWGVRKDRRKKDRIFKSRRKREQEAAEERQRQLREMSDNELRDRLNRIRMEQEYSRLMSERKSVSAGRKFVQEALVRAGKKGLDKIFDAATTQLLKTVFPEWFKDSKKESKNKKKDDSDDGGDPWALDPWDDKYKKGERK